MSAHESSDVTPPRAGAPWYLKLYPRAWRERYGDELSAMVGDRPLSMASSIDLVAGAIDARFTKGTEMPSGKGYRNDQAQRTAVALAQGAGSVILFQTLVAPIVVALIGIRQDSGSTFTDGVLWGFISSLLRSAVTLGPVALVSSVIPWRDVPYARAAATLIASVIAFQIGSHVAWGPAELVLVLAGAWIGYRTVSIEPELVAAIH